MVLFSNVHGFNFIGPTFISLISKDKVPCINFQAKVSRLNFLGKTFWPKLPKLKFLVLNLLG